MNSPYNTLDTTRVYADNSIKFSITVSRITYPNKEVSWRPSAVILVPIETFQFGFMGASLIHFPINASFLLTGADELFPETLEEILRLSPTGEKASAQVFLVGPLSQRIEGQLNRYGLRTLRIGSQDIFKSATQVAYFRLVVVPPDTETGKKHVIITAAETCEEALPAPYFSAHMGVPIIFVMKHFIPEDTLKFLEEFRDRSYTIFGSERTISRDVENKIAKIVKYVERIPGSNSFEISVNFSRKPESNLALGWGRNVPRQGNAFSFGTIQSWQKTLAGLLFAHMGKHTPLLAISPDMVPHEVKEYITVLNPAAPMPEPPFMHGYILGDYQDITFNTQVELEELLILKEK